MQFDGNERDPIRPVSIDHSVDEIWADDARQVLEQVYNFLDYHFEKDGIYCRARTYMDTPNSVTVYGPFADRNPMKPISDPELVSEVMTYLRRRFREVQTLESKLSEMANSSAPDLL